MFEKSLDSQLWLACAGGMVQIPPVNTKVYYFPQGHAEHAQSCVDFGARIPSLVLCRVSAVKFLADVETDEVYVRISLVPLRDTEVDVELETDMIDGVKNENGVEKLASFAKTLTQSDANNGGGFSVPRYCAETIFPPLDYSADPPVQTVVAKDVHGEVWRFRHIYRGTPRRHLLTTGWSNFVNKKKLVAGDSIVFLRSENGELRVGIRRAKRGFGDGLESPVNLGWSLNAASPNLITPQGGFSLFYRENESRGMKIGGLGGKGGRVRAEDVLEASSLAANGQPFEVVYYPRASTPEFCVKATAVRKAMRIYWHPGIRFKMAFETEDSSRISWFMGTVDSVQVADPIRWANSPWRLLQVTWDEPDLLQNVKRISPWLVEQVTNVPPVHLLTPFSPTRKKLRFDGQFPSFLANPLGASSHFSRSDYNTPTGIQGARHVQIGLSLSSYDNSSKLQLETFPSSLRQSDQHSDISGSPLSGRVTSNNSLRTWNSDADIDRPRKRHQFLLFGQPILTEQQISLNSPSDTSSSILTGETIKNSDNSMVADYSSTRLSLSRNLYSSKSDCEIFMESEDVGRTLDLSVLGSYEELYMRLAIMFGVERSNILNNNLRYQDAAGAVKRIGDEPFSVFTKAAKRLTIVSRPVGNNNVGRAWNMGTRSAENGIEASNKTGPLTMFA